MRHFSSYGPVDQKRHFCVARAALVERCIDYLVDDPEEGGHYFTIWGPRQTGKTWLMRQAVQELRRRYGERFLVATLSMQGVILEPDVLPEAFLPEVPPLISRGFGQEIAAPTDWKEWTGLFRRNLGLFDRPVILLIDEFDRLPRQVIDRLVALFRDMYLDRQSYLLHGLALIGVRSVLGVDSATGSPFNVQRSLHVPNLTRAEVTELFDQYRAESGQPVEPEVITALYEATRGQPGLVSWFGELLTEKYQPGADQPLDLRLWEEVYLAALRIEWNNTVLNLVKKARARFTDRVLELFGRADLEFELDAEWSSYLYQNGIIDHAVGVDRQGRKTFFCRFSCPFVQRRLYHAFTGDLVGDRLPILALHPLDDLADVFAGPQLDVPALLRRYLDYLVRQRAAGLDPFQGQPRRADLHLTELSTGDTGDEEHKGSSVDNSGRPGQWSARGGRGPGGLRWRRPPGEGGHGPHVSDAMVGHFHLYAWLREAVGRRCVVSPEFPTGNGQVDLHLSTGGQRGILEVKSFTDLSHLQTGRQQAAHYAQQLGLDAVTLAVFVPTGDQAILTALSTEEEHTGVRVTTVAIGWEVAWPGRVRD